MSRTQPRNVLASSLKRLIERDTPQGQRPSIRAWALGKGLDVRMIDRLVKSENAATIDKLEEIAAAVGLEPWHLLIEDVDINSPPKAQLSTDERELLNKLRRILES